MTSKACVDIYMRCIASLNATANEQSSIRHGNLSCCSCAAYVASLSQHTFNQLDLGDMSSLAVHCD